MEPSNGLDVFVRHQIYVEGFKNGLTDESESLFEEIAAVLLLLLTKAGYERLNQMPKRKLNKLITEAQAKLAIIFKRHPMYTSTLLRKYVAVELKVQSLMYRKLGKPIKGVEADALTTETLNTPVSAAGIQPLTMVPGVVASIMADMARLIRRGFADQWTLVEFTRALVGTAAKGYRDGELARWKRNFNSTVQTVVQHTSSYVNMTLGAMITDRYQWVSVLDSVTSKICRSRSGTIYYYGRGPRPPAHYNCRSTTVPVIVGEPFPVPTFHDWLRRQPRTIATDFLGAAQAQAFRNGEVPASELQAYSGTRSLTLSQFEATANNITLGV